MLEQHGVSISQLGQYVKGTVQCVTSCLYLSREPKAFLLEGDSDDQLQISSSGLMFTSDIRTEKMCDFRSGRWCQRNVSNILWNSCCKELSLFWRAKEEPE